MEEEKDLEKMSYEDRSYYYWLLLIMRCLLNHSNIISNIRLLYSSLTMAINRISSV
jgi:hypothetical protein